MGFRKDLIDYARLRVGRLADIEMPEVDIVTLVLPEVIDTFGKLVPQRGRHQITLVPDQSLYDLPNVRIFEVLSASPFETDGVDTELLGDGYNMDSGISGGGYSTGKARDMALERHDEWFVYDVFVVGDKIEVVPTPTSAETMYLETQELWNISTTESDWDTIPRIYHSGLRHITASELAKAAAMERARLPQTRVGSAAVAHDFQALYAFAEAEYQIALSKLPSQPKLIFQG